MITIRLSARAGPSKPLGFAYRVAAQKTLADTPLPELELFAVAPTEGPSSSQGFGVWRKTDQPQQVFHGETWLGADTCVVTCWLYPEGYLLSLPEIGQFRIAADGSRIEGVVQEQAADDSRLPPAVVGPPLILALALRNVWCLHAGAVGTEAGVVAFLAKSGLGKSTLASRLPEIGPSTWRPVADDLLPVELEGKSASVLPRFPQLKLGPESQWASKLPERMPLRAICVLQDEKDSGDRDQGVDLAPLSAQQATVALVGHTFASFLFAEDLLQRHLSFCADLAGRLPVCSLSYPRRIDVLPAVAKLVLEEFVAE